VAILFLFLTIKLVPESSGGKIADGFSDAPFGAFAGYVWIGSVHSVGASFTVPRVARGSALSEASTWKPSENSLTSPQRYFAGGLASFRTDT
jgi:hypothetical protein